jgi:hypothetical protein
MKYANPIIHILMALLCVGCGAVGASNTSLTSSAANSQAYSGSLVIVPNSISIAPSGSYQFTAEGGTAPYTFKMYDGGGGVIEGSGVYTAPSTTGNAELEVIDANNLVSYASIVISGSSTTTTTTSTALSITAGSAVTLTEGQEYSFSATGGSGIYNFSLRSGLGSITTAGLYTAPSSSTGTAEIAVADTAGSIYYTNITITTPVSYTPVMVYEYEASSNNFTYSLTANPISGYVYEGPAFQIYSSNIPNSEALYLCTVPTGGPFLSTSATCEGNGTMVSTLGYIYTYAMEGFYPLYRFVSQNGQHYMESTNYSAGAQFGLYPEGVLGYVEME